MGGKLVVPYGNGMSHNMADEDQRREVLKSAGELPSWTLSEVQVCDLELLLQGGFAPLCGYMGRKDYEGSTLHMRMSDGLLWPCPVSLDVSEACAGRLARGGKLVLREPEGSALGFVEVEEVWRPDTQKRPDGDGRDLLMGPCGWGDGFLDRPFRVGGRVFGLSLPVHFDFSELRKTPREVREEINHCQHARTAAFFTDQYLFRPQFEATFRAATELRAGLLINSLVPTTWSENVEHFYKVRSQHKIMRRYPRNMVVFNVLPLMLRGEALRRMMLTAIVARNFGCAYMLVDEASLGLDQMVGDAASWEEKRTEEKIVTAIEQYTEYRQEIGVEVVRCRQMAYLEGPDSFVPVDRVPAGVEWMRLSQKKALRNLESGAAIPDWYMFKDVLEEVRKAHPPREKQGFTLFFTGLSGSGKSTVAKILRIVLLEIADRQVTLLDGDIVRRHLSKKLGFSREDRDINIRRIGFVAAEITKNGGIALCAPIAPYDVVRKQVRSMVEKRGGFILVHMATSLEVCESRDPKGMYAKARSGTIANFTGISDPYETPEDAEIILDAARKTPRQCVDEIVGYLRAKGYILS